MGKRKDVFIFGALATAGLCFLASKFFKSKEKQRFSLAQGLACFSEKDYTGALEHFLSLNSEDFDTLLKIFECYENLGDLTNALIYISKCISIRRMDSLVLRQFKIHSALEMDTEAFKDLFLLNLIRKDNQSKENAGEFLRKICAQMAKTHKAEGFASPVNYSDFFDTLFFLKDEQDPAVVFLNSGEYDKCFEFIKESKDELHRLILGCFYLVNGDFTAGLRVFESVSTKHSEILIKFIKSKKLTQAEIQELRDQMSTETDSTVLFYIAKIFENLGEADRQYEAIQKCITLYPNSVVMCSLIVWYIRQKNHSEAMGLIKSSLKEYSESINLVCIALEYYIMRDQLEEATALLEKAEKVFTDDPRTFLFKFMISEAKGEPDVRFLKQGIQIDPLYFKLHFYLGDKCTSGEESAESYKNALKCARSYDEVFSVYQLLIVVESQNALFKKYPDLFVGTTADSSNSNAKTR